MREEALQPLPGRCAVPRCPHPPRHRASLQGGVFFCKYHAGEARALTFLQWAEKLLAKAEARFPGLKRVGLRVDPNAAYTFGRPIRLKSKRGAEYFLIAEGGCEGPAAVVRAVSILKPRDPKRRWTYLCNGQAATNCVEVARFGYERPWVAVAEPLEG